MKAMIINLILLTTVTGGITAGNDPVLQTKSAKLEFPALPYAADALEPFVDKLTMEIHHGKHHKAYYDNFMKAIAGSEMENNSLGDILKNISKYPAAVRNNGGGFYNHILFWENMAPAGSSIMSAEFEALITKKFGSIVEFKRLFSEAGKTRFGSGWAWLSVDASGELFISSTPNQDNPLMDVADKKGTPILALDVWEHAYYLKYQNRRPDYIDSWWNIVNWSVVEARLKAIK
ncbi:MAG: superoxide dismutase [Bacteroidales bacterium]